MATEIRLFPDLNTTPNRFRRLDPMGFQPSIKCLHRFIVALEQVVFPLVRVEAMVTALYPVNLSPIT